MKTKNLLLISLIVLIFSCKNDTKTVNSKVTKHQIKLKKNTTRVNQKSVSNIDVIKDTIKEDSIKNEKTEIKKDPKLKVIIEGKAYYKKNINDKQKGSMDSYVFFDIIKKRHYDIKTGEYELRDGELGEPSN